ncbi:heparan-alpha-glucosaminide N-acetyltransferase domain-containing protein [Desulfococcaceae bacterium HSG8]|nr:heparan-alpha-glucosaminide N-acetyltransferase domain-containing protein [Desulfococcaceae bacterium HSG8]
MNKRIKGFDFARALAIFGMVLVNFKIVMNATRGSEWLLSAVSLLEGRASAIFVILAGVGITLMTGKARLSNDINMIRKNRLSLLKRSALLIFIGLLYSPVWPADILHFYGFYIAIAAFLFTVENRTLLLCASGFMLGFVVLLLVMDYETGWNWDTLTYQDFWSAKGMFRHIFFNGFHPVFPWAAFLFIGLWLGRLDVSVYSVRRKLIIGSLLIWSCTELLSYLLIHFLSPDIPDLPSEIIVFLLGTKPMPPMPQYIIASGSLAVLVISLSISLTLRFSGNILINALCKTGQISLTLYVSHVIIGMGFLEAIGRLENQSVEFSVMSSSVFALCSVLFAHLWVSKLGTGPLERVFRRFAS